MRITIGDILGWPAVGMSMPDILEDFLKLEESYIYTALAYAEDREH
jgi:uncharacterized protein (DUF433 family)